MARLIVIVLTGVLFQTAIFVRLQENPSTASSYSCSPSKFQQANSEVVETIERIKKEADAHSQVENTLSYLTEVIGPRLTAGEGLKKANEWTRDKLKEWGLENARLEPWGPFGRTWSLSHFQAALVEPQTIPLIAYPKAWSPGTPGTLVAPVVYIDAQDTSELQKYRGRLKDTIVLMTPARAIKLGFQATARRQSDSQLLALENAPRPAGTPRFQASPEQRQSGQLAAEKYQFFSAEGVALVIEPTRSGVDGLGETGTIFIQSATVPQPYYEYPFDSRRIWPWQQQTPRVPPQVIISAEQYNRLVRMAQSGLKLRMRVELEVQFPGEELMSYNTLAEIPGEDLKDEIVMIGAHLDSWHSGTGATDNACSVAAIMEAVRILNALKVRPRRTIRIALWSGEEQGLRGSRSYVARHFAKVGDGSIQAIMDAIREARLPSNLRVTANHQKFSVYFNLDTGAGKIRGLYLQGNERARPLIRDWLGPLKEMGVSTVSLANSDGSDNLPFDIVGLPSFQFLQDPLEYWTVTHHSNQDLYDRVPMEDLRHNVIVVAALLYRAAMAERKVPRK